MNDVIDRLPGPAASTPNPVRATTVAAVSVVAAVAAAVSFLHMHDLAARAGEGWRAWLAPLAVDGLVIAASMTMLLRRRAGNPAGWLVWVSMGAGITASLAANVAAAQPTLIGRAVAAWPPLALLLAYELLMQQVHDGHSDDTQQQTDLRSAEHDSAPASPPPAAPPPTTVSAPRCAPAATPALVPPPSPHGSAPDNDGKHALHGTTHRNGHSGNAPPGPILQPTRQTDTANTTRHAARQLYRQTLAQGTPCTGKQLAQRFGMSERWGRYQIRAARTTAALTTTEPAT